MIFCDRSYLQNSALVLSARLQIAIHLALIISLNNAIQAKDRRRSVAAYNYFAFSSAASI